MATGLINQPPLVPLAGLSPRTTSMAAQRFTRLLPPVKDVGYVTRPEQLLVYLWNGSASATVLTSIDGNSDADGIEWDAAPPVVIDAARSLLIAVTVTLNGPLAFTALLTFVSPCALDPILTLIGTRAPTLTGATGYLFFPHNWEDGFDEELIWKTDVLVARDRTEQRVKLRTLPRRIWNLRLLAAGSGRRLLETWLSLRRTRYLFTPLWRDETRITAPLTAGASLVSIEHPERLDFAAGRWLAVYDAMDHFEIRKVTGVGADYVAVDLPFAETWPQGAIAAPCRYGLCLEQRRLDRFSEEVTEYSVAFEAADETDLPAMANPILYRSLPVCPFPPSWLGDEETIDNKWVRLDNDTGVVEYDIQSLEPVRARTTKFLLFGRADIDLFLRFLFYCSGRLAPFWLASTERGFELAQNASAGATTLTIVPLSYEYALKDSPARSHLELVTTTGTVIRRMITGVETLLSGEERLTLDSPLPCAVTTATLERCAWFEQVRLDADALPLQWFTGECLEVNVPIMVLP